jgi:hypothetical protein
LRNTVAKKKIIVAIGKTSVEARYILNEQGKKGSARTGRQWLQDEGWECINVIVTPDLKDEAKKRPVVWSNKMSNMGWSKVVFTDL